MSTTLLPTERHAILSLSLIMSLRMIGLFMVLPLFSTYAIKLQAATPFRLGIAMGIYGLLQALCQIPFGALSDRIGRKPVITLGLILFSLGSFLAGRAETIFTMILGRALQGTGAIGGTTLALLADLTRLQVRTFAMAIAGMTIGASFALAMLIGPILTHWITFAHLFFLTGLFGLLNLIILYTYTPSTAMPHPITRIQPTRLALLTMPALRTLNIGIFILHAIFTASFLALPLTLLEKLHLATEHQWTMYAPALGLGFIVTLVSIRHAEKTNQTKRYFQNSIALLLISQAFFLLTTKEAWLMHVGLFLFFTAFSLLEAMLPSCVSKLAPSEQKGSALGLYSFSQFLGIFVGGMSGGVLLGKYSFTGIYLFCMLLTIFWLLLSFTETHSRPSHPI